MLSKDNRTNLLKMIKIHPLVGGHLSPHFIQNSARIAKIPRLYHVMLYVHVCSTCFVHVYMT